MLLDLLLVFVRVAISGDGTLRACAGTPVSTDGSTQVHACSPAPAVVYALSLAILARRISTLRMVPFLSRFHPQKWLDSTRTAADLSIDSLAS